MRLFNIFDGLLCTDCNGKHNPSDIFVRDRSVGVRWPGKHKAIRC